MANYQTPGVYIQEVSTFPPSIAPVATAIPAFLGYTEIAAADPVRITSMADYQATFGGPHAYIQVAGNPVSSPSVPVNSTHAENFTLYYALQMYFANGGGPCYVISVGDYTDTPAAADYGTSWNEAGTGLGKLALEDEPTLIVMPDLALLGDADAYYGVWALALQQCANLQDRFCVIDVYNSGASSIADLRNKIGTQHLKYGAVYYPDLVTTLAYPDAAVKFNAQNDPDGAGPLTAKLLNKTLSAAVTAANTDSELSDQLLQCEKAVRDFVGGLKITLPPSSAVVGVYAATDRNRGVWKAPANVSLTAVSKPSVPITHEDQADLNLPNDGQGKSVNAIRAFTGKGILVWGARTLAGNDNEWRYVPVRRLYIFVEESVKKATEFVVFEPNDANTWLRVKTMIQNFLTNLWKDGALAGATPEDAFFVKVGLNETMTPQDVLEGKLIIEIGMAAVRPAEFIILKFSHKLQES